MGKHENMWLVFCQIFCQIFLDLATCIVHTLPLLSLTHLCMIGARLAQRSLRLDQHGAHRVALVRGLRVLLAQCVQGRGVGVGERGNGDAMRGEERGGGGGVTTVSGSGGAL